MKLILKEWNLFKNKSGIGNQKDNENVQSHEMRKAFYGGFTSCLFLILRVFKDRVVLNSDVDKFNKLLEEVTVFFNKDIYKYDKELKEFLEKKKKEQEKDINDFIKKENIKWN